MPTLPAPDDKRRMGKAPSIHNLDDSNVAGRKATTLCISRLQMELMPSSSESRSSKATLLGLLDPEDEGTTILRNKRKYPATKPHPLSLESSAKPL